MDVREHGQKRIINRLWTSPLRLIFLVPFSPVLRLTTARARERGAFNNEKTVVSPGHSSVFANGEYYIAGCYCCTRMLDE